MVFGVITGVRCLWLTATNDAPRSPVVRAWGAYRVLTVITPSLRRESVFAVAEYRTILAIRKVKTLQDLAVHLLTLQGQFGQRHAGNGLHIFWQGLARQRFTACEEGGGNDEKTDTEQGKQALQKSGHGYAKKYPKPPN